MKKYLVRIALLLFVGLLFIPYANAGEEFGLTIWHNVEFDDFDRKVYHDIYDYLDNVCYIAGFTDLKTTLTAHPEWINQATLDGFGFTPLHFAVIRRKPVDYIRFLLDHGADVNCTNTDWKTPLHMAILQEDTTFLLLSYNADITKQDIMGNTPLHVAAEYPDSFNIVELLLTNIQRRNLDPSPLNYRNNKGITALHVAVLHGNSAIVNLLLKYGADIDCKDNDGRTPLDYAKSYRHKDIAKTLKRANTALCIIM